MTPRDPDERLRALEEAEQQRSPVTGAKRALMERMNDGVTQMVAAGVVWAAYAPGDIEVVAARAVEGLEASAAPPKMIGLVRAVLDQARADRMAGVQPTAPTPGRTAGPALENMSMVDLIALALTRDM